jgi:hypothetical protein
LRISNSIRKARIDLLGFCIKLLKMIQDQNQTLEFGLSVHPLQRYSPALSHWQATANFIFFRCHRSRQSLPFSNAASRGISGSGSTAMRAGLNVREIHSTVALRCPRTRERLDG